MDHKKIKISIPLFDIFALIKRYVDFRNPQICRHLVAADLLSLLEKYEYPVTDNFLQLCKAIVDADDLLAKEALDKIME